MSQVNAGKGKFVTQSQAQFILDNQAFSDGELASKLDLAVSKVRQVRRRQLWAKLQPRLGQSSNPVPVPVAVTPAQPWSRSRRRRTVQAAASSSSSSLPVADNPDEPIVAFRMWYVDGSGMPSATFREHIQWSSTMEAKCLQTSWHQAPVDDCECGVHALSTVNFLKHRLATRAQHSGYADRGHVVVGAVLLTGRTVVAEMGFRAAKAQVIAVSTPVGQPVAYDEMVTATAAYNLQVPVVPFETLEAYAAEYGRIEEPYHRLDKARRARQHEMADRTQTGKGAGPVRCPLCEDRFADTDSMLDHHVTEHSYLETINQEAK